MYIWHSARIRLVFVILFSLLIVSAFVPLHAGAQSPETQDLQSVWDSVRRSGAYFFRADLTRTTTRTQNDFAYGSSTQKTRVYMEGDTDLDTAVLNFTMWNGGGTVMLPESGTQVRIEKGQALARRGGSP